MILGANRKYLHEFAIWAKNVNIYVNIYVNTCVWSQIANIDVNIDVNICDLGQNP